MSPNASHLASKGDRALAQLRISEIASRIRVREGGDEAGMPEWAACLTWLGAWCRSNVIPGKRLVTFCVLPTRELSAAFAGLGCLAAGAALFEDALTWPVFRKLPTGRVVFWSPKSGNSRYQGAISGFKKYGEQEFIVVDVTKAPRRVEVGFPREISQRYFDDYRFTVEEPPPEAKAATLASALTSLSLLAGDVKEKWIWADGAEGLLLTNISAFESSIADLSLSIGGRSPLSMADLLCSGRNKGQAHGKLRIEHPRGFVQGDFPLAILDGESAFSVHEHLKAIPNLLVILDRSEYTEHLHDVVLGLRSVAEEAGASVLSPVPKEICPCVELGAFLINDR